METLHKYVIVLVVLGLGIGALFIPVTVSKPVEKTKTESYQVTETVNLDYSVLERSEAHGSITDALQLNPKAQGYVRIENTDTEPGTFQVDCHFRTAERDYYPSARKYIEPGETEKITCRADTAWNDQATVSYEITPGTKEVTKTKERNKKEVVMETRTLELWKAIYWKYL